jgi:hypothetical protein
MRVDHVTNLRNIYEGASGEAKGSLTISPDDFSGAFDPIGQIEILTISGISLISRPLDISPVTGVRIPWSSAVHAGGEILLHYQHWHWYKGSVLHEFFPGRFTKRFYLKIRCQTSPRNKKLLLKLTIAGVEKETLLGWDGLFELATPIVDLDPGVPAYLLRLGIVD